MAVTEKSKMNLRVPKLFDGLHYAWIIIVILAVVHVIGESIFTIGGIVAIPLTDPEGSFGWNMIIIGIGLMMYYLFGSVLAPVAGWLGERYGARRLMLVNSVLFGGSMIFLATVSAPWQFFLAFGFLLSLTGSILFVPLVATLYDWFRRRLGLAVGITLCAGGIGSAILAVLIGYLIDHIGWQATFWGIGIVGGGVLLLLTVFYRNRPSDVGIEPYGTRDDDPPEATMSKEVERLRAKVFNKQMRRTRAFWNLPVIHGLGCAGHGIVIIYSIPLAYERGVFESLGSAAMIIALINIFSITSRLITPLLAERYGGKPMMAWALLVQGLTILVLFWAQDVWSFYLFAVLFGLGFGSEMSAYLVVNRQYFGKGPLATCYGFQTSGALMGHAIATALAGLVIYVTESYNAILAMSMIFSLVGVVVIMTLESTSRVLIPNWEESLPPEARSTESNSHVPLPTGKDEPLTSEDRSTDMA